MTPSKQKQLKLQALDYADMMHEVTAYIHFKVEEIKHELNIHICRKGKKKKYWTIERNDDILCKGSFEKCCDFLLQLYLSETLPKI